MMIKLIIFGGFFILICLILLLYKINNNLCNDIKTSKKTIEDLIIQNDGLKSLPPKIIKEKIHHPYQVYSNWIEVNHIIDDDHREYIAKSLYYNIAENLWKDNQLNLSITKNEYNQNYKIKGEIKIIPNDSNN